MASSAWKGFITFGLISIPVKLFPAARSSRVGLHQLHAVCKTRLRQPLFCPTCNRIVERSEVVKGYEYEDGKYVVIDPEEIKKIAPESARAMEILAFVKESEIDPLFFDSSYFLVPEDQGKKAYKLLLKTMEDKDRVAIAKLTMHQREYTVFLRPYDHGIALHTMYFANEIREAPGYGKTDNVKITPQEIKLADQLVDNLSEEFQLKKYHDEFETRLRALIDAKQKGRDITATPRPERAPVIDMMTALKKSLERTAGSRKSPLQSMRDGATHEKRVRRKAS
jgi:DNA end-binding protein Ku